MRITESQLRRIVRRLVIEQAGVTYKKGDWVDIVRDPNPEMGLRRPRLKGEGPGPLMPNTEKSMVGKVGRVGEVPTGPGAPLVVEFPQGEKSFSPEDVQPHVTKMQSEPIDSPFMQDQIRRQRNQAMGGSKRDLEAQMLRAIDEKDTERLMSMLKQAFGSKPDPESAINDFLVANGYGDMASEILHMYFGEDDGY